MWLVAHRAIAVGVWRACGGEDQACASCGQQETQRHCLWDCEAAQQIWLRLLRLFLAEEGRRFTWGAAAWGSCSTMAGSYEASTEEVCLQIQRGRVLVAPRTLEELAVDDGEECDLRWELISSLSLWFVWRAWCRRIFEGRAVPPAETVRDF